MKVVHVYKDYYPPIYGGVEVTINALAKGVHQAGQEVTVLVANRRLRNEKTQCDDIPVIKVADVGRLLSAPMTPTFPMWLNRTRADILHFHIPNPTAVVSYLLSRPSGQLVVHYHSDIVRQKAFLKYYRPTLRSFLSKARAIIVTSPNYLATSETLQEFKDKCRVVPLSVDPGFADGDGRVEEEAALIRQRYGDRPIVLFVGVLRYYKGARYLIEAMKGLPANLLIVGNGPLFRPLVRLRDRLGLRKNVFFMGSVPDVRPYFRAAEMFCLPSTERAEAFGIVLLEAMACGLPLVTSNLETGVSYVNRQGETGLLVPPRDVPALHDALDRILTEPELRRRLSEGGRKRFREEFTHQRMIAQVLDLYRELVE